MSLISVGSPVRVGAASGVVIALSEGVATIKTIGNGSAFEAPQVHCQLMSVDELKGYAQFGFCTAVEALAKLGHPAPYPVRTQKSPIKLSPIMEEAIDQYGWAIGITHQPGLHMQCTIGCHHLGFPEVFVAGLQPHLGARMLNEVVSKLIDLAQKNKFNPAIAQPINNTSWTYPFYWVPVDREAVVNYFTEPGQRSDYEAVYAQIVLPDRECKFPWDQGYAAKMKRVQKILGCDPVEPKKPTAPQSDEDDWSFEGAVSI